MTTVKWKVAQPNTMRTYTLAAKDYEAFAGSSINQACAESITAWKKDMQARGLSINTIRTRLIAIGMITGIKVALPKRSCESGLTLSFEQLRLFFAAIKPRSDRVLMASILFTGTHPRRNVPAHFVGSELDAAQNNVTTQEITRKVKRYARLAGLSEEEMNLRTLTRTGKVLLAEYAVSELVKITTPNPSRDRNQISYRPLHGIGRRSNAVKA